MPIFKRRRKDDSLDFPRLHPFLRIAIRKVVADEGIAVSPEQRRALLRSLTDSDALEAATLMVDTENLEVAQQRDWKTFFEALTQFVLALAPILMEIFGKLGV